MLIVADRDLKQDIIWQVGNDFPHAIKRDRLVVATKTQRHLTRKVRS